MPAAPAYPRGVLREVVLLAALLALAAPAQAQTIFDYVTFDGIDYIRWFEEPGRALARSELGTEFATVECSFAEDRQKCAYGVDASAAFIPAGTRLYAVPGFRTDFRLAAVASNRVFLYQAWRNPRAKTGADLFDIAGRVRAIEVQRGERTPATPGPPLQVGDAGDRDALVRMIVTAPMRKARAPAVGEPRYWLTFWLTDGTTLGRPYFVEAGEVMGGLVVPEEFRRIVERYAP